MAMRLSTAYKAMPFYAIVYHTFENSDEVDLVVAKFFKSEHKAWWYFMKHGLHEDDYKQVEVVRVTNFDGLTFEKPELSY